MQVQRNGDTLVIIEPGTTADETYRHEFTVLEDYRHDEVDALFAEDGLQPKASLTYATSVRKNQLGYEKLSRETPPKHVVAFLIGREYLLE